MKRVTDLISFIIVIFAIATDLLAIFAVQRALYISLTNRHRRHYRFSLTIAALVTPWLLLNLSRLMDRIVGPIDRYSGFQIPITLTGVVYAMVRSLDGWLMVLVGVAVLKEMTGRSEREEKQLSGERVGDAAREETSV